MLNVFCGRFKQVNVMDLTSLIMFFNCVRQGLIRMKLERMFFHCFALVSAAACVTSFNALGASSKGMYSSTNFVRQHFSSADDVSKHSPVGMKQRRTPCSEIGPRLLASS